MIHDTGILNSAANTVTLCCFTWQPWGPAEPSRCCGSGTCCSGCSAAARMTRSPPPSLRPTSAGSAGTHRLSAPPHRHHWWQRWQVSSSWSQARSSGSQTFKGSHVCSVKFQLMKQVFQKSNLKPSQVFLDSSWQFLSHSHIPGSRGSTGSLRF